MRNLGVSEIVIELRGTERADGSVLIYSEDLPLFSAVGKNEEGALEIALELLPEYLAANVPEYVDFRAAIGAKSKILHEEDTVLPAYLIASVGETGGRPKRAKPTA